MTVIRTVAGVAESTYSERGSKFLGYCLPVQTVVEVGYALDHLRKEHPKARHFCFAYRIGEEGDLFRFSDDGEPSGTAGKPILGRIDAMQLTFTLVVVVRYFGGKLLGAAGLLRAYRAAAQMAIESSQIKEVPLTSPYRICVPYALVGRAEEAFGRLHLEIDSRTFSERAVFRVHLPRGDEGQLIQSIIAYTLQLPSEQVGSRKALQGLEVSLDANDSK